MENNIRLHITLILLCILSTGAISQNNLSGINNYHETIWLTSSRHLFLSGESIDFTARLIEQDTYLQSYLSKNMRVELLNSRGQALKQQNLILSKGNASGVFVLPEEAPSGWYYLRAYTNWMRNFDSSEHAVLAIKVFNTEEKDATYVRNDPGKILVSLFPNGTSTGLYAGYDSKQGVELKGTLFDSSGASICSFSTHSSGWSMLNTDLDLKNIYTVEIEGYEASQYYETPEITTPGPTTLSISDMGPYLSVEVSTETPDSQKELTLILHQSYTLYWESGIVNMDKAEFRIPKSILPGGIKQFSLVSQDNNILSKKLWADFTPDEISISLSDTGDSLDLRSSYSFDYSYSGETEGLSVFIGMEEPNFPGQKFLPGLKGWPCTSDIPNNPLAFQGWLLANSYSDNVIFSILESRTTDEARNPKYLPETRSGVISGKVLGKNTGLTLSGIGVSITVLNNNYFDACRTDDQGQFYFSMPGQTGTTDYILNFTSEADSGMQIFVNPEFEPALNTTVSNFSLDEEELQLLKVLKTNLQLSNIYGSLPEYEEQEIEESPDRITFFHPPDQVVVLEDFIKLANIREVIYEVVPNVSVRKTNGHDYVRVNSDMSFSGDQKTLVLLDGIPLADHSELLNLSPDRIEKIEVKNRAYVYGRNIYSAIVNFVSPNRDYAGLELPSSSILSTLNLPGKAGIVKSKTSIDSPNIPLLESTLFWKFLDSSGKNTIEFKTNDATGTYRLVISGFNREGNWMSGSRKITISK